MPAVALLRTLCKIKHGGTPSKKNLTFWTGDIPWVSPKDMKASVITDASDHISPEAVANSATSVAPIGSILLVVRSGILAHSLPVAQVGSAVAFNQDIKALIPDQERIDSDYLYWFVRGSARAVIHRGVKKGPTVHSVQSGFIENLPVPLLTRSKQRRVVDILSRAEGIVHLRRDARDKASELIPAHFLDMFGDPATNPKRWSVRSLGDLISDGPQNGLYKHASFYGEGTPILRIDAFYDGRVVSLEQLKRVRATSEERHKFQLQARDIVINRVNSVEYLGKSTIVPPLNEQTVFESNMMRLSVDDTAVLPEYLIELLQTVHAKSHFLSNAKHAINQSSINQQDVKSLPVPIPSMDRQIEFADYVQHVRFIQTQQITATQKANASFDALLALNFP